ncbi:acyl dehydratase [Agromyces sp. 3263]|uniref:HYR domain-containing protein n=1 Tax=Agromyces sp. 3263 TaxID=2817750 RepID=UPI0028679A89|nr:HYR domain-containing protein [Agromyces sp. 3263]MDR6906103.1 acyl dehydratase [Agromyces sp. 3263]
MGWLTRGRAPRRRRGIRTVALGAALGAVAALTLVVPAQAAAPSFVDPPTRLYMAPAGSLPVSLPAGFPTFIPEGELAFDGATDLISQDVRTIAVESAEAGCVNADPWNLTGCTAVQLSVSHGTLDFSDPPSVVDDSDSSIDVLQLPSGALVRDKSALSDLPAPVVAVIGTTQQVNDALKTLVYTPDDDSDDDGTADDPYFYNGSNPETLAVTLVPGDPALSTAQADIQIRVQELNDFPEVEVPDQVFQVPSGGSGFLGDAGDDAGQPDEEDWNVVDEDNDEQDGDDTIDGPGDEWLLIAWTDCGMFAMPASPFTIYDDLEELMEDTLDLAVSPDPADPEFAEYEANRALVVEGAMNALPDEVKNLPFATGNPSDPHSAFAGVVSGLNAIDSLNYALDQVEFLATGLTDVTCTVRFLVSDLGNNGLPLQYLGDPPYGMQVPFFGLDLDTNDVPTTEKVVVQVGAGTEVDVTLPTDVPVAEGATGTVPVTITPAEHPAFDLTVSTAPVAPTTADVDYTSLAATTIPVPADAAAVDIPVDALADAVYDPGETYTVSVTLPADPPGYGLTSSDPSALVTIGDDDLPPDTTAPTVTVEQGATQVDPTSTLPITFDVELSEPAVGLDATDVDLAFSGTGTPVATLVPGGSPTEYTVTVTGLTGDGVLTASIGAGAFTDAALNANSASTSTDNEVTYESADEPDTTAPTVTINQGATQVDPAPVLPIAFDVAFSEPVLGFAAVDVTLAFTGAGTPVATVVPGGAPGQYVVSVDGLTSDGLLTASIAAGVATDAALNPSAASTSTDNSVTFDLDDGDVTAPTVTIDQGATQVDPATALPIVFDVAFSEPVVGFTDSDVTLVFTGTGTPAATVVPGGTPGTYTVSVTGLTSDGVLTASIAAGVATDAALNPSAASTSTDDTVTYDFDEGDPDVTAPTVTIDQGGTQADPTDVLPIVFDVAFSEPVIGFTDADLTLAFTGTGTPAATVVPGGTPGTYTVSVNGLTGDGVLTASIAAGVATDAALNPSAASTSTDNTVRYALLVDEPDPLTIDVPDDIVVDAPPGEPGVTVVFDPPTTTGGVAPITVSCDHASGELYPIGVTTITCTATDSAPPEEVMLFAVIAATFTITVNATTDPGTGGPGDPGTPGGSGSGGSGSGGSGSGSTTGTGSASGIASTGVETQGALLAALALLLAGAAAARIGARRLGRR